MFMSCVHCVYVGLLCYLEYLVYILMIIRGIYMGLNVYVMGLKG
jgi:hypothetical protein